MYHYRDSRGGDFYLNSTTQRETPASDVMPFLRFAHRRGIARNLWASAETDENAILQDAALDWPVQSRPVLTEVSDGSSLVQVPAYQALVRPDTREVMSVVTSAYRVAENAWVARTALALARKADRRAAVVGAAGFGRTHERSIFVVRVCGNADRVHVLLVYNTHGGEGAVRFQLVEADRSSGTVLAPASGNDSISVPHVGDLEERLENLGRRGMVPDHISETREVWRKLQAAQWTADHTSKLLRELWGEQPNLNPTAPNGTPLTSSERARRHPARHLTSVLSTCSRAANAYQSICAYMDNESEACERGDFTKDRDERLALGAGLRMKQRAWRWIVANT